MTKLVIFTRKPAGRIAHTRLMKFNVSAQLLSQCKWHCPGSNAYKGYPVIKYTLTSNLLSHQHINIWVYFKASSKRKARAHIHFTEELFFRILLILFIIQMLLAHNINAVFISVVLFRVGYEVGYKEDRLVGSKDGLLIVKAEQLERPLVSQ